MGFIAEIDEEDRKTGALESSSGTGEFPPLARGKYQAIIRKVVEHGTFGGTGDNATKPVLKIEVQIVDGSPTGRNRVYFPRVPLFTRWASGKANTNFTGFWRDAIGWPEEQLLASNLPGENDILGKQITITLGAPKPPDQWNALGSNEVDWFDAAGDVNAAPTALPKVAWLDEHGKLIPGYVAPQQGQAPQQQTYAPPAYQAPAQGGYAPAAQGQTYQAPAAPGNAWAPDPADVQYATAGR